MAGNIPLGSMSTEIKLNGSQSVKTLRELKQAVAQATSAWKAQRAELSNIGKSTEAAQAKYKGLAETIKKQKDYISGLQVAQKHLQEAQKSVDRTTKEGRQEYGKYNEALQKNETRLHSAQQKLASLVDQQSKAKKSLDYYKSGLAEAQKQLKLNESVTRSYINRLSSEGKSYEAAKAKLNGYKDSIENLTKQQKIQEQELSKIASESGKSSEAYKRQQVRVNETAASIAKLNGKVKSTQKEVDKLNPNGFNKIANGAKHVTTAADKMKSALKGTWEHVKTGATAAAAGIGAVGVAALSGAKKAGDLQQAYKEITNLAVTGGEKQKEALKNVTAMQRQGRDMSIKYGKSQQSIAEAYEELVKRGYTTKQALGAMKTELQGSVASGDDFKDVVSVSSTVLESFGMRAKSTAAMTANTKRAVNELAYAADMTSTGFKDLGYGMSYVGSSAHQAGFSLSETASAMGILSNNGLEASKAGTGLNQVINRLSDAAGKLAKGDKKNVLAKLGITPNEITNSKGQLKSMSTVFGVLEKHMKGMTKVQKINIMKSLFGVNGEQAGLILAKYNKELGTLSGNVLKAGKNGKYVSDLAAKNSQTAKMQMARLKQAGDAFAMTLGAKMLPAINAAGDSLVVFLTKSKDGKKLTNDLAKAVEGLATGLANTVRWIAHHRTETKLIAEGLGAAYGVVKLASLVQWLNKTRLAFKGLSIGSKFVGGFKYLGSAAKTAGSLIKYFGKGVAFAGKTMGNAFVKQLGLIGKGIKGLGSGILNAVKAISGQAMQAGKFLGQKLTAGIKAATKFSMGKRLAVGALAGAAVATPEAIDAVKDRHSANKRSQDIGGAVGALAGGALTSMIPVVGPLLAPVGAVIGKYAGRWGGQAVNKFTKGWQRNKPPKKFWSLENLGYSAHNMWKGFTKGVSNTIKWFKKNWKEVGLYFISPLAGAINSLYKHNKGFHKWVNGLVKGFKNAWNGVTKWFSELGKNIQKSWKGMTKWFKNLGKNMAKGLKSAWESMTKWFSNIGNGIKKAWKSMTNWFTKLGKGMSKGLKATWYGVVQFFSNIGKNVKYAWNSMTSFFSKLGKNTANFFKRPWKAITGWFKSIISGIKSAWDGFWDHISGPIKTLQKLFTGKLKVGSLHLANGTDWRSRYGVPAVVNDAPGENYREGLLINGQVIPFPDKRNIPFWLLPGQDIVNGNDMAKMFGHAVHYANGTVYLSKDHKYSKKNYELAKKRAIEDKKELEKLGDKISNALKRKDGNEARRLTNEFDKLTKKYSADKKAAKKPDPHAGKVLVDQGLLIGAKSRIGHSVYISKNLFKKLIADLKKKKTAKKRKTSPHRRKSTSHRRYVRRATRISIPKVSSSRVAIKASVSGRAAVKGLASAIRSVKSRSVKLSVKSSGSKSISSVAKAVKKIKGGTHRVKVKTSGVKSLKSLYKYTKKIKGKTHKVQVKTSGTKNLKSLQENITSVHKLITSLTKTVEKNKFGKSISEQAVEAVKSLKGKGNFAKQFASMTNATVKDFRSMTSSVGKTTDKIRKSTEQDFDNLYKRSYQSVNRLHDGVIKLGTATARGFGSAMHKMIGYASDSMRGTIRQINRGIRGIDAVLKQFGGNSSVINPVHFAKGTDSNGRLTHDTLAVVNDAENGPRQEAIVTNQNDIIIPHGNNRTMMLRKGWGVLNGTQTQSLSLPHFASGTGINKEELRKLAKNSLKHFAESFKSMFTNNLYDSGSDLTKDTTDLSKRSGTHYGDPWSQAMWTVINKAIGSGGGSRAAFLRYAKEAFNNVEYQMGAASKTLSDCSGMVMQALRHFGINIGRTTVDMANSSGTQYLGKDLSKTEPGDLVIFGHGTGAAGHVGIINNPAKGTMFNETPPYARISKISDAMSMGYGYYRVKALHDQAKHQPKIKASLLNLAKRELGNKALSWIGNHLSENEDGVGGKPIGDHLHWLKQAGIPEKDWAGINYIVSAESGWNPNARNPSSGTYGLGQMQGYNLHYYTAHGAKSNSIAQLMGIMDYIHDRYGSVANAVSFRKAHNWYANGGIANKPSIFGEAGPEMAIPLVPSKSTRAWELIGKAVGILSGQSGLNQQQAQIDIKKEKEEHDFKQAVLLLLTQLVNKSNIADIKLKTPQGRTLWEVIEPFSKAESRAEMIKLRRGLSGR
ncbi:phage tail tape measure protein [Lactobacillus helveticus]|uniref:phage tail tape measure protein n=1 Tax=Lactobacillus helveticus TaxID=1587 RepID=UPI001C1E3F26|nr:phage tail tape measure protein [Lactobacillus helveticus]MBU5980037.1 phage tail tape measure protein [Lactobacillus helveticus]MCT3413380.1 phage tail tape measure protein [Lactobacillus helveticus]